MINALVAASLLLGHVHGFATVRQLTRTFTTPSLCSSLSFNDDNNDMNLILHQAVDCSSSDSCSVEQAEWYLSQVMSLQQECTIGDDDHDDNCDNPEAVSRIISQLQNKILHASMSVTRATEQQSTSSSSFASTVKTSPAIMAAGVVLTLALTAKVLTTNFGGEDTVAFTAEEWWWALRDNYLPLMVIHFIRDGGLHISEM
ncbi:hypothetical protein MHU86_13691 [Fragilaria crotonensis]|nr:hypothetical protein MHU86_13691 [Fragilaria crotonensis]